jgi:hypothetical protein
VIFNHILDLVEALHCALEGAPMHALGFQDQITDSGVIAKFSPNREGAGQGPLMRGDPLRSIGQAICAAAGKSVGVTRPVLTTVTLPPPDALGHAPESGVFSGFLRIARSS